MTERGRYRHHIKTLERRRDHLAQRLNDPEYTSGSRAYDQAELSALGEALVLLREKFNSLPLERGR